MKRAKAKLVVFGEAQGTEQGAADIGAGASAQGAEARGAGVVPRVLVHAAKAYAKNPKKLGEVIIALVEGAEKPKGLDEGQTVVLTLCREELAETADRRRAERERKARWRSAGRVGAAEQPGLFDGEGNGKTRSFGSGAEGGAK